MLSMPIPTMTPSEQADDRKNQVHEFFKGDDLSGLNLSTHRARRYSYDDVEELIKQEFKLKSSIHSKEDEESSILCTRSQNKSDPVTIQSELDASSKIFSSGYKMKLNLKKDVDIEPSKAEERGANFVNIEPPCEYLPQYHRSIYQEKQSKVIGVTSRRTAIASNAFLAKRRLNHKLRVIRGVKNSGKKLEIDSQQSLIQEIQYFFEKLSIKEPVQCKLALDGECDSSYLQSSNNVYMAHGEHSFLTTPTAYQSSIFQQEFCSAQVEELVNNKSKCVLRKGFPQDVQRSCRPTPNVSTFTTNHLLIFEKEILLNLVIASMD